ncbi:hypothetical protein DO021_03730 [Desulfobacter hydrogenophilus]|uniref:DUF3426 domain-containing protein n=1 Tax=Desulfobacter hydrogenophilus TaxID=2291 RepID=A0A328FG82_9BACT|nr:DUF3426 domain-containing protein [Desulfobacter hydrogenophilus]NDY70761.1 DUF3426 domain-containing protein [Desulfobacter hydrogenophilus]QBH12628.1 DUF3426 domain-containing protein [Desulfobacter hydrogenophilus]RAM03409.1 hypothetical protein DO021_03730 [Desulfobacter hydrogenophilus]
MIITCEKCSTQFVLDDALIKPEGSKVRCGKCRHVFTAFPPDHPEIELSEQSNPEEQEIQNQLDFNASQDDDFNMDSDSHSQNADLEDTDIDFSGIEFDEQEFEQKPSERQADTEATNFQDQDIDTEDPSTDFYEDGLDFETAEFEIEEPELDFQDDGLKQDTQEFEFEFEETENEISSEPASMPADSDTTDIEISFDQDDSADLELELEELSFDMDDPAVEASSIDDLELDTKQDDDPGLEFEDDPQADLIIEDDDDLELSLEPEDDLIDVQEQGDIIEGQPDIKNDGLPADDIMLESDDDDEEPDDQNADEKSEQTASEQDKFAEYDKVLEQEIEPEDTGITVPDPGEEDNIPSPVPPQTLRDEEIETITEAQTEQEALIIPSAQSVRQKRSTKKEKRGSLAVKILLVLVLLILAAYVAIIRLGVTIPVVSDIQIPVITQWLEPKQAPQPPLNPVLDEPSIDGRFVSNKSAGDLFIITGRIKNPSNTAVSYLQVKGTLMKKDNTKAETLIAYCGNIIPEETLKSGNISDIAKQMGVKQGNQNTNVNIKPGASVMFMLVFSNLPEDLSNFTVAVEGFEPAQE